LRTLADYEVDRQIGLLENGETVQPETRAFDSRAGVTTRLRSKESVVDYRWGFLSALDGASQRVVANSFLPEPDLLPLRISPSDVQQLAATMPLLPAEQQARLQASMLAPCVCQC
jgi:aspartyl-tRNA(Asn)/glutamyl-tRNA(Gln) amidotransferase subunit B